MSLAAPRFVFITCQRGAEPALKHEIAGKWPDWRFSFSRPGFLTFKLPSDHRLPPEFELGAVFARAYGFSVKKVSADPLAAGQEVVVLAQQMGACRLHVWERDLSTPGHRGFEPGITPQALGVRDQIIAHTADASALILPDPIARPGEPVLDCVLVESDQWWLGYHRAQSLTSCNPGGFLNIKMPAHAVSRAYLKMEEAIRWSKFPLQAGQLCAEIGSSPGGASQALLERGLHVIGVDPAEMDPVVLAHPRFIHLRKRGHEVRRREFRHVRWLTADINLPPTYTLDTVAAIVTHPQVEVRGLLLTLKLLSWDLAANLPEYLNCIRSWGYDDVRARQLAHNRQEICVAALKV